MKPKTVTIAILVASALGSIPAGPPGPPPAGGDSLYVWHAALRMVDGKESGGRSDREEQEALLRFCTAAGIDVRRLYFQADPPRSDRDSLGSFLQAARGRRIDVYALPRGAIQNDWMRPFPGSGTCDHDAVLRWVDGIVNINESLGGAGFHGIQLDIEPHVASLRRTGRSLWQKGREGLRKSRRNRAIAREYLRLLDRVREVTRQHGLVLAVTLPATFDRDDRQESYRLRYEGRNTTLTRHVMDRVEFVTLMNYVHGSTRKSRRAAWRRAAGEVAYGPTEVLFQTDRPARRGQGPSRDTTLYRGGEDMYFRLRGLLWKKFGANPNFIGCGVHYYRNAYGGGDPGWPRHGP